MSASPPPLVCVVMPAHDVAPYVAEAVRSALSQTHPRVELIAVDDGSTDGTGKVLDALTREWTGEGRRMVVRRQANAGAAAARNAALAAASGEIVAFLDADDRWHPELVARMVAALSADPSIDLAVPRWRYVDAEGRPIGVETPGEGRFGLADLLGDNPIHSATGVALRRGTLERAGGFDPELRACIDLDLWVRAIDAGSVGVVPGALADYRRRPGQITGDWRRMERAWTRVHDKLVAAGRGLPPAARSRSRGRACLFWSAAAYEAGDHAAARHLMLECWRRAPAFAAASRPALTRSLAAGATLLPRPWHDALRARFNAATAGRPGS